MSRLLTLRTIMCAALTNQYAFDPCATDGTFLICAPIHSKLEFAAAIDPIKRRTVTTDSLVQDLMDRVVQRPSLSRRDRIGCSKRMQLRHMQCFICVDV